MTSADFVASWRNEKDDLVQTFMGDHTETLASQKIKALGLSDQQAVILRELLEVVLTDTMYTLLLGLDGAASIGGSQHSYKVFDESGTMICGDGLVEIEAYSQFHQRR